MLGEQIKAALHRGEHAEREAVDLHEFKRVDIVLVPLDHLAIRHGGGLDGDELVAPVMGQDEAAGMLREMAGRADEMTREIEREPQPAITQVEIELGRLLHVRSDEHTSALLSLM